MRSPGLKSRVMFEGRRRESQDQKGEQRSRDQEMREHRRELGLAGPRAGEDASGCPDAPAGRRRWGCGARWPLLPTSTPATCATSCRRGVSTAPSCNRHRHRHRRRCRYAAPARLPRGSRSAPASAGPYQVLAQARVALQPPSVVARELRA